MLVKEYVSSAYGLDTCLKAYLGFFNLFQKKGGELALFPTEMTKTHHVNFSGPLVNKNRDSIPEPRRLNSLKESTAAAIDSSKLVVNIHGNKPFKLQRITECLQTVQR